MKFKQRTTLIIKGVLTISLLGVMWAAYGPFWYGVTIPTHPAIDETRVGLIKELKSEGFVTGKTIDIHIETEGGNLITIQPLKNSDSKKVQKIHVAIGTTIAQQVKKNMSPSSYLVFSSVTDPIEANLISTPDKPEGHVTGVSNFIPAYPQLHFFQILYPKMKKVAFLYNPNEINSTVILKDVLSAASKLGLNIIQAGIKDPKDVESIVSQLPDVDAFYVNNDNTVASEWGKVVRIADERKIPAFSSDTSLIKYGALAAYGVNQYEVGRATATMVIRLLKGEDISRIPMVVVNDPIRMLNDEKAKKLGLTFSLETLKQVDQHWPEGWLNSAKDWFKIIFSGTKK